MKLKGNRKTIAVLATLVGLSGLIQAVVICRAALPSIDAVRFVRIAQAIDSRGLLATISSEREQPLFPLAVSFTHGLLARVAGESPSLWATSAQLAAVVPLVLSVIPIYFLCRRLVGSTAAFAAGIFFCVLPEVASLAANGISDSLHLFFFTLAYWALVEFGIHSGNCPSIINRSSPMKPSPRLSTFAAFA